MFREMFGRPGNELKPAYTCYWYQSEPHVPFPPLPAAKDRAPLTRDWRDMEKKLRTDDERRASGVKLEMRCGRPEKELVFAEPGYHAEAVRGFAYTGWPFPVFHTRADEEAVHVVLHVPPRSSGLLRLYMIDPDHFQGGRRQEVFVGERSLGIIADFDRGHWLEAEVDPDATAEGTLPIRIVNCSYAVITPIPTPSSPSSSGSSGPDRRLPPARTRGIAHRLAPPISWRPGYRLATFPHRAGGSERIQASIR